MEKVICQILKTNINIETQEPENSEEKKKGCMEHPKECTDTLEMNPKGMDTNELPEREMKIVILRKIDKRL